jgi:glutamate/tyrosine decarboxylase-like PLP-dependent enzyme
MSCILAKPVQRNQSLEIPRGLLTVLLLRVPRLDRKAAVPENRATLMIMPDKLAVPHEELRALIRAAGELVESYYSTLPGRPVLAPSTSEALREKLSEPLPLAGVGFDAILTTVRDVIYRYSRHNGHPRFFGYVASPGTPVTAVGSMIEAALNANVTAWRSCPPAVELEHVVIDWLKQMLGYPASAAGMLVSGGSMANFAALAAARSSKQPEVIREGLSGVPLTAYVSAESHFSVRKAAGMLGIGEANVRTVSTDARLRMDPADLERLIQADLASGRVPLFVSANLGTVASGAVDPIGAISLIARRYDLWFHVDAAYGGFAALAPSCRAFFEGIPEADSVTLDPHKWLYTPVGCGCVLYKNPAAARSAFAQNAEYTRVIGLDRTEAFAFWDYGLELSRPFRAFNLWLLLKYAGAERIGQAIESNIACAKYFEKLVCASEDFEMLNPVELSIFCFRYSPPGFTGNLDLLNEHLLLAVQRAGSSYLSNAHVHGKFALRGCVLNYRTTERDMERLFEDVRSAARERPA